MRIEYTCASQSGCERLRIYRRACGKSRLWEKHVRPNTNGTVEGRLQGTRKIPLAKVGIPSAFRPREDVKSGISSAKWQGSMFFFRVRTKRPPEQGHDD